MLSRFASKSVRVRVAAVRSTQLTATRCCTVNINFLEESSGTIVPIKAKIGEKVVDIAIDHDIDIEAACGGELACSTCHVVLPQEFFDKLEPAVEEEEDMLDLAWGLTDRSRLCCQITVSPELEGCTFTIPTETNNQKSL